MYRPSSFTDAQFEAYKEAVAQPDREWELEMTIALDSGYNPAVEHPLELTEDNIVAGSLTFNEQSTCSDGIMVGSTFSNALDFSLINGENQYRQYNFLRAQVVATIKMYVPSIDKWAIIPLGTFIILDAGKKYATIPIKCMDAMCLFNRPLSDANPSFPESNLRILFKKVCSTVGVVPSSTLSNEIPEIPIKAFDAENTSCRDFLAYVGCLTGQNLRISRDNQLEGFWYTDTAYITTPNTRINTTVNDLDIHPTGVTIKDWNGVRYPKPIEEDDEEKEQKEQEEQEEQENSSTENVDTSYLIAFEKNPLIQTKEMANSVLENLTTLLTAVQYKVYDCQFSGDPTIQAGDSVIHNMDIDGSQTSETVNSLIMAHTYKFRGTGKIAAFGKTAEQDRQLTATAKKILEVETKAAKDLNDGMTAAQQAAINQSNLFAESMALYPGIKYTSDGQIAGYYMASASIFDLDENNQPIPIASDYSNVRKDICYVWTYGVNGIGVSDTGFFDSPNNPNELARYTGFTKDSSIIAKMITADWINTGVLSAKDDSLQMDLAGGTLTLKSKLAKRDANGKPVLDEHGKSVLEDGWGNTVLDGIGALFTYWNKEVTGHPPIAFLKITADADEQLSTDTQAVADMKLVWSAHNNGEMYTSMGHTITHDINSSEIDSFQPFEIKSRSSIHISPSLYYDEAVLFDNILMRRTNTVYGNTGVDFLVAPGTIPTPPVEAGQIPLHTNGFDGSSAPWDSFSSSQWRSLGGRTSPGCIQNTNSSGYSIPYRTMASAPSLVGVRLYVSFWAKGVGTVGANWKSSMPASSVNPDIMDATALSAAWKRYSFILPAQTDGYLSLIFTGAVAPNTQYLDDVVIYNAGRNSKEQWDAYIDGGAQ